ncbi:DUF1266 domain-containing protein [Streptomyces uncialis]|uniref:DUF1266 domain-containing protein n=1 Tax=Streptomyces uncialis TaxID=1048205 RepID=UPI003862D922|nr:DUF1266 domain-containing protein [Streptomyces uncialis]
MDTGVEDEVHDEVFPKVAAPADGSRWTAPTDIEQRLHSLCAKDNDHAYLRTVALEGVYYPVRLDVARARREDGDDASADLPMLTIDAPDGRTVAQVYTTGLLPRPHPYLVYEYASLGRLAFDLPAHVDVLAVNVATPCERYFATDAEERKAWLESHNELFDPDALADRVVTLRSGGPGQGDLLHGLACGAHLCFANGEPWNAHHWHGGKGHTGEVDRMAEGWDVGDRDDWLDIQERLLLREVSPWGWDFVLDARTSLLEGAADGGADPRLWRDHAEEVLRARLAEAGRATAEQTGELVHKVRALVGSVLRYESRFRADGLLPPGGRIRSVAAWDLGRASQMARWGRGARYATQAETYAALERVSRVARVMYGSWEEFSAGYVLGRCLHFDEESFGSWYTEVLDAHRALITDPDGPWRTVPFTAD